MINKICIVTSGNLPVPDVRGGAIERLMNLIIEDNEKYHRAEITLLTISNPKAKLIQQKFKYTSFVNIITWGDFYYRFAWKLRGLCKKLFHKDYYVLHPYERQVVKYLLKHAEEFQIIINEGLQFDVLDKVATKYGNGLICAHLHCNKEASSEFERIYGSVITVSDYIRNQYLIKSNLPPARICTVFNGIDITSFRKSISESEKQHIRSKLNINSDDFIIIYCGRLVPEKGIKETIEVISEIGNPKIKLLILGSSNFGLGNKGIFPKQVIKLINNNSEKILFTGYIPNEEIYKYHQISNVGIIPSLYNDPCPLSMFEMIASGLPTIATKLGGMSEIGTTKTTIFINKERFHEELINAIEYLYNKVDYDDIKVSSKERAEFFRRERFYEDYMNTISMIINNK